MTKKYSTPIITGILAAVVITGYQFVKENIVFTFYSDWGASAAEPAQVINQESEIKIDEKTQCLSNGKVYKIGDNFRAPDNCNSCGCVKSETTGKAHLRCTAMYCFNVNEMRRIKSTWYEKILLKLGLHFRVVNKRNPSEVISF